MDSLSKLPPELIAHVCSFLPPSSLKVFRCTRKAYAAISEEQLFRSFEFKLSPSHHRLYHLEKLAAHPTIAPRLKCLAYESGVQLEYADFRYWQANIYQEFSNARSNGLTSDSVSKDEYTKFHAALQARFTTSMPAKYDLYRWHLDHEASMMAKPCVTSTLVRILDTLSQSSPNLKLKVVMSEPQISLPDLENFHPEEYAHDLSNPFDPRQRVLTRRANTLAHFTHFLEAANLSSIEVTNLSAIALPHQLLTVDDRGSWSILITTFQNLRSLTLQLSAFPNSDWLARGGLTDGSRNTAALRFARLLSIPIHLTHLHLSLPPSTSAIFSPSIFSLPHPWRPHLTTLSLSHISCPSSSLITLLSFLPTLSSLTLSSIRLTTGSLPALLSSLPHLSLTSLSFNGTFPVDSDLGTWHAHSAADFTDCVANTTYEGPYLASGWRARVEEYALKGEVTCPLPEWDERERERVRAMWEQAGDTSWHYVRGNVVEWG